MVSILANRCLVASDGPHANETWAGYPTVAADVSLLGRHSTVELAVPQEWDVPIAAGCSSAS